MSNAVRARFSTVGMRSITTVLWSGRLARKSRTGVSFSYTRKAWSQTSTKCCLASVLMSEKSMIMPLSELPSTSMTGIEFEFTGNGQHECSTVLKTESDCKQTDNAAVSPSVIAAIRGKNRYSFAIQQCKSMPMAIARSGNLQQLVRLDAQLPLGIIFHQFDRQLGVACGVRAIHGLQQEMFEVQLFIVGQHLRLLRNHHLEFTSLEHLQFGTHLRTHADPVNAWRNRDRAVGFNRDLKPDRVHAQH